MDSRNPVFGNRNEFGNRGYAGFNPPTPTAEELSQRYEAPSATPAQTGRMTLDDVVMRSAALFAVLLLTAGYTFIVVQPRSAGLVIGAAIVGLVLAVVNTALTRPIPPLMFLYAAVEGVFVGGVSFWYDQIYSNGIVAQAVLGTLSAFAAMLGLYATRVIRVTDRFRRTMMFALVGYVIFALVHFLGVAFGLWGSIYASGGLLAIGLSAFGVGLASLSLALDFDMIEQGIRNGVPRAFAWTAAFGLIVTLVWLYLEILRLLSVLRND